MWLKRKPFFLRCMIYFSLLFSSTFYTNAFQPSRTHQKIQSIYSKNSNGRHFTNLKAEPSSFLNYLDWTKNIDQFVTATTGSVGSSTTSIAQTNPISPEVSETIASLSPLGNDLLIFLCATIGIVPLFQRLNASPVLGFLAAGLVMGPAGLHLFSDLTDMESIADYGVLFLLFEQGLELTIARLQSVSKYAFGMGTLQVLLCTIAFFIFPFIGGVQLLEWIAGSDPSFADVTRIDEAFVIGAALSLSSSAFVLKILQEKHQMNTKFGEASLGILLLQDIAVVPLLVLLPIIESGTGDSSSSQFTVLGITLAKALIGLGSISIIGGRLIRSLFSVIATTRSSETFVALCILVAVGVGLLTDRLGLSSTLGAFVAGTLLAESNYRTQIETDIKPFKGLLLGLFFLTTGASVDPMVIQQEWPTVLALLGGLITFKTLIISLLGPFFDLTKAESIKTGLVLSGGGEFAFVLLTLADKLHVIPDHLAKILVGVVVLSMALTPTLSNIGDQLGLIVQNYERKISSANTQASLNATTVRIEEGEEDLIVICGYNEIGQIISKTLDYHNRNIYLSDDVADNSRYNYVAFDLDPQIVARQSQLGKRVVYGDGSQALVLNTAGVVNPKAFIVAYEDEETMMKAVERIHESFPSTPVYVRAENSLSKFQLREAGATSIASAETELALQLSSRFLKDQGNDRSIVNDMIRKVRLELEDTEKDNYLQYLNERTAKQNQRTQKGNVSNNVFSPLNFVQLKKNFANIANSWASFREDYLIRRIPEDDTSVRVNIPTFTVNSTVIEQKQNFPLNSTSDSSLLPIGNYTRLV